MTRFPLVARLMPEKQAFTHLRDGTPASSAVVLFWMVKQPRLSVKCFSPLRGLPYADTNLS
jgi:hypothetical protein